MKRLISILAAALALASVAATPAAAQFGFSGLELGMSGTQAGIHPEETATTLTMNSVVSEDATLEFPDGQLKHLEVDLPEGFAANPTAVPTCSEDRFAVILGTGTPDCPNTTVVGIAAVKAEFDPIPPGSEAYWHVPVYNLERPPGSAALLGFNFLGVAVLIEGGVRETPPYNVYAKVTNTSQSALVYASEVILWGNPASSVHDTLRGNCLDALNPGALDAPVSTGTCKVNLPEKPFLTAPRSCEGPLVASFRATAWNGAGEAKGTAAAPARTGCTKLGFSPEAVAEPTTPAATSPSGLSFQLEIDDEGLISAKEGATADSDIKSATVLLPEGMTVNPSQAEGLEVCTEAQLARETASSAFGAGCPAASKIGGVEAETPLLESKVLKGSLFVAEPYTNPFGSLLALYMVIQDREMGISVKLPARVDLDPATGRVRTTFGDPSATDPGLRTLPQLPLSDVRVQLREGARSPLVTPAACGSYETEATFTPWADPASPYTTTSSFEITTGSGGGPCASGGLPPFRPALAAGTISNRAGAFSPFVVGLSRTDSEQEFTRFSIKLPPGVAGKLAGIPACSDLGIAQAASRTGPLGGQEELNDPSCPAASEVGRTLAGAGVGQTLAYAPGKIYLGGPYGGAPISFVAITSGVVGPFDVGTVVVRLAIEVNPETGEVFLDAVGSDPIPHIIKGVPLRVREIRAFTDRPQFTFNPTSCEPTSTSSTVLGSGLDFASPADDNPVVVSTRFQAADCASLPFRPKLRFKLKGSTRRGGNPSLRARVRMNGFGEAAIRRARVTLPKSQFLDQAHIGTVCTRVQFNATGVPGEGCPAASVYGKVIARTPILDGPLAGPIFLRANGGERELPDLVAALHHGQIDITLVGFIDTGKRGGGIRNTFAFVPDAPVSSADFTFFGGKKGLLDNSRNLCRSTNRVRVNLLAHSGKRVSYRTPLQPTGCKKKNKKRGGKHRR